MTDKGPFDVERGCICVCEEQRDTRKIIEARCFSDLQRARANDVRYSTITYLSHHLQPYKVACRVFYTNSR